MENDNNSKQPSGGGSRIGSYWVYALIGIVLIALNILSFSEGHNEPITQSRLKSMIADNAVEKVVIISNQNRAHVYILKDKLQESAYSDAKKPSGFSSNRFNYWLKIGSVDSFVAFLQDTKNEIGIETDIVYTEKGKIMENILSFILPIIIIAIIWIVIMRRVGGGGAGPGAQIFNIGKSKATLFDQNSRVDITFADVAGLDEAKEEVMEVVDFLKNPKKYTSLGGKIPKGVLLVGPPGTGKTLLAKAVAGEAGVPFFSMSGSDFVEMFVGVGASRVRDLFKQAREKAPCIVFIDEIDAIGRARGRGGFQGGNDERENTLNQLLVEMDGFSTDKGVILMAATNRPDVLDSALLRPGRFDRQISIDRPDLKGRAAIFNVHLKNIKVSEEINAEVLAEMTPGFAGAEIANLCNEAALIAARRNKKSIDLDDFNYALDKVIGGLEKKNKIISPEEKKIIAYHEAGHALCGWYLEHAMPLLKVTIVPRGVAALGYAQYLPKEQYIIRTEQLLDQMCMTFGGRAAEQVVFNKISTGAQNDLDRVTKMAYDMITIYGMNDSVGQVSFYGMSQDAFQRPYSDQTATLIDNQVRQLVESQYQRAQQLLTEKRDQLEILANALLEKEVILKSDVVRLIGPRPYETEEIPQDSMDSMLEGVGNHTTEETPTVEEAAN